MQTQQANFDRARAFVESRYGDSLDSHQKAVLALEMSREMSQEDFARRQAIALMISRAGEGFSEGMRNAQTPIPPLPPNPIQVQQIPLFPQPVTIVPPVTGVIQQWKP
jgi:hypothetical protein